MGTWNKVARELMEIQQELEGVKLASNGNWYQSPDNIWYTNFWGMVYDEVESTMSADKIGLKIDSADKGHATMTLDGQKFELYCRGGYMHRNNREETVECFFRPGGKGSSNPDAAGPASKPKQVAEDFVEALNRRWSKP